MCNNFSLSTGVGGSEKSLFCAETSTFFWNLGTFTTDAAGKLDVLGHDGDTFGMDSAQVGVFEKSNKVSFAGFLKGHHGTALETQVSLEILSDLTDKTLEGELSDQKLG